MKRCSWCESDPQYIKYHDQEWGVPVYDDRKLFEFLILEGAQAGLSWLTILKRREGYREAFKNFVVEKVAKFSNSEIKKLLTNEKIVRHKLKIESAVANAKLFLKIQKEFGSFSQYQWSFVGGAPLKNKRRNLSEIPSRTEVSDNFSSDLKKRGFKFVGSTIIYAYMQAIGMVNDHFITCPRYDQVG